MIPLTKQVDVMIDLDDPAVVKALKNSAAVRLIVRRDGKLGYAWLYATPDYQADSTFKLQLTARRGAHTLTDVKPSESRTLAGLFDWGKHPPLVAE